MISLGLERESWDICVDGSGNLKVANGKYRIAQDVATSIRLFKGEAFFAADQGIPYWAEVLTAAPQVAVVREHMRRQALKVPGVAEVGSITFESLVNRRLTGTVTVRDSLGETGLDGGDRREGVDDFYSLEDVYSAENIYRVYI